jgi:hypothetical protein
MDSGKDAAEHYLGALMSGPLSLRARFGSIAVAAVAALVGLVSACGGSGGHDTRRSSPTAAASAGTAAPKAADNAAACAQAARQLQAADQVSSNHGADATVRVAMYRLLAQGLTPVVKNADGDVAHTLTALVSLLFKAGIAPAESPEAERALVAKTDPELRRLRSDLARACGSGQ